MYINFSQFNGKFAVPLPRNQMISLVAGLFCFRMSGTTSGIWNLANGGSSNLSYFKENEK